MILNIEFPNNLYGEKIVEQKDIPCVVKVSREFKICFDHPLPFKAEGVVKDWDIKKLDARAPAYAGGRYTHYDYALISLEKLSGSFYKVISLSIFTYSFGWCPVIDNGDYAVGKQIWASDDDDPDYIPSEE